MDKHPYRWGNSLLHPFYGCVTEELRPAQLSLVLKWVTFLIFNVSELFGSGNHKMFAIFKMKNSGDLLVQ